MSNNEYVITPDTQQKVYEGSVVILYRLPNLKWILHYGYYSYNGVNREGWYFSSIPADTQMPVFRQDLMRLTVVDAPVPPQPGPFPPGPGPQPGPFPPGPGPFPPAPSPTPFTSRDKAQLDAATITVANLTERDKLSGFWLVDGKVVKVNDVDGHGASEYYSWNSTAGAWEEASFGYRYMTRSEIQQAISSDIVSIVWSDDKGALVVVDHSGVSDEIPMKGLLHDPIYIPEDLTLRIPIYGKEDFTMTIPRDNYMKGIRFEAEWEFEDHHVGPAIVVTITDGVTDRDLACDASSMVNIYQGSETDSIKLTITSGTNEIVANVKIADVPNNPLNVDDSGLWVDLSGVVAKQTIDAGMLLVADGNGQFTYAGDGVTLDSATAIEDLEHPEKVVVTANLIADAIRGAIEGIQTVLEGRIEALENAVADLQDTVDIGHGSASNILVASGSDIRRSDYTIGGSELSPAGEGKVALEDAVISALSWKSI